MKIAFFLFLSYGNTWSGVDRFVKLSSKLYDWTHCQNNSSIVRKSFDKIKPAGIETSATHFLKKFFHFKNSGWHDAALQYVAASRWGSELQTNFDLSELYEALTFVSQILKALDFVLFVQRCLNLHDLVYFLINLCENKNYPLSPKIIPSDEKQTPSSEENTEKRLDPGKHEILTLQVHSSSLNPPLERNCSFEFILFSESSVDPKMLQKHHLKDHRTQLVKFLSLLVVVCLTQTVLTEYFGKALVVELQEPTDPRRTVGQTQDGVPRIDGFIEEVVELFNAQEESVRTKKNLFLGFFISDVFFHPFSLIKFLLWTF